MKIRTRLTLRFIVITAIIMLLSSTLIYVLSADYRRDDFYSRLENKANNTAKLLIEVDEVSVDLLRRLERDNPVSLPNEKITIYNFRDTVVFTTDEENLITVSKSMLDNIRLEEHVRWTQDNYEVLGFLFRGRYDRFVVVAGATDIYGFKRLTNLISILLLVFALSIVIVTISGWIYAGRALKPIANVINRVDEISISSLNLRVDEGNGQDEISRLAQTFNNMLTRLETSFLAQKNFISNASHELRTPLTVITGQLEVILLKPRSAEEYVAAIHSVLEDIRNLNILSNRLLLLAQSASTERRKKMHPLRLDELLWQVKEDLTKLYPVYLINIDLHESLDDERKLTVIGDEQLMKAALSNLIENACKYSPNRTVGVYIYSSSPGLSVIFSDSGIGIPQVDLPNIFEPFYRGSNTGTTKGHGIGLSMVKGILKIHGGTITIQSARDTGTIVTVWLPPGDERMNSGNPI